MRNGIRKNIFRKNFKPRQRGAALLIAVLFFLIISLTVAVGSGGPVIADRKAAQNLIKSKASYFTSEAGTEDVSYRIIKSKKYGNAENLTLNGYTASMAVVDNGGVKEVTAVGNAQNLIRKIKTRLIAGTGASFHYGVQVGEGGIIMENSSRVAGNVFSNGPIVGQNSNTINGDIVSAGPAGSISGSYATGTAYAHSISNSKIDKDAYYAAISNTTVGGTKYPNSPDQATSSLPITDAMIDGWKTAAAVSVISSPCPYVISSSVTIGPVKINCDLEISGSPTITIAGPVWVNGNIEISGTPTIKLSSSLGGNSVAIIADNPANRTTSSKIELANSAQFQNSGTEGSYVLFVSQNNSAQNGGSEKALTAENSISGEVLVYAGHGEIQLKNSVSLREVSAYRIRLSNSSQVIYKTGLANLIFTSGPSGGYSINSWQEIQ
ncbi:hypothetical protein KGQ29_01460 [Patescibacteria group bacterium]|nr:hypothetical protein [Patescibacteria group bacterium]